MIDGVEQASCVRFCMQTALEKDLQAKENQKQKSKGKRDSIQFCCCSSVFICQVRTGSGIFQPPERPWQRITDVNMSQPRNIVKTNRREYVLDSGASVHMMARHSLPPEASERIRPTDKRLSIQTANGIVEVTREADVYINELDTYVYIKLVEDSPAVLSVGRFL